MANWDFKLNALKPLKRKRIFDERVCTFDIETTRWDDPEDMIGWSEEKIINTWHNHPIIPTLLTFYDGEETFYFDKPTMLLDFVKFFCQKKYRSRPCFVHNGGKFDLVMLYAHLLADKHFFNNYKIKHPMQKARIMALILSNIEKRKKTGNTWILRDSFCLLPYSLPYLCKTFKPKRRKLKMPKCKYEENKSLWQEYCAYDCYSLREIILKFGEVINKLGGTCDGYTIPSIAMKTFRLSYQTQDYETYYEYNHMFRTEAYFGGRCEVINAYARPRGYTYSCYDINSMYPYVMYKNKFPISKPRRIHYNHADECFGKVGIMECDVQAPLNLDIPILPVHFNKKLYFPLGQWKAMYDFSLVEFALKHGYDIIPLRAWEFDSDYIFKPYIKKLYPLKLANKGNALGEIAKLLQNSLYGKTGEKEEREELVFQPEDIKDLIPYDEKHGFYIKKYNRFSPYHLPAIALRVCALAQIELYKLFEEVELRQGHVLYCDTDSVMTDVPLNTGLELGELKEECQFTEGIFLRPKLYYLKTIKKPGKKLIHKKAIKGFSNYFKKHMTYDMLYNALITGDTSKFYENVVRPTTLKEISTRSLSGFNTLVEKNSIQHPYDKRKLMPDFTTKPYTYQELLEMVKPISCMV
jgi:hypothetical protein